jgi:hypothetical protein
VDFGVGNELESLVAWFEARLGMTEFEFDIVVSYASEDVAVASEFAKKLKDRARGG